MAFEWDERKDRANQAKHGVTFATATTAFDDPAMVEMHQVEEGEERWKAIAMAGSTLLAIIYTERGAKRRIISARKATRNEQKTYREG